MIVATIHGPRRREVGVTHAQWYLTTVVTVVTALLSGCALTRTSISDYGIPFCEAGAGRDLLSSDALQCWFEGRHGRWRLLGHQSHLAALVVEVDARDLRDANDIAERVVASVGTTGYTEVLVYVRREAPGRVVRVSRVAWTPGTGFEAIEFAMPPDAGEATHAQQ